MAKFFLYVTTFLWIAGALVFILAQIFFRHEKCSKILEEIASWCFGLGLVTFVIMPLFTQTVLWCLAGFVFFLGVLFIWHSKG